MQTKAFSIDNDLDCFFGLKGKTNKYKDFSDRDLNILISKTLSNIRTLKDSVILSFESIIFSPEFLPFIFNFLKVIQHA